MHENRGPEGQLSRQLLSQSLTPTLSASSILQLSLHLEGLGWGCPLVSVGGPEEWQGKGVYGGTALTGCWALLSWPPLTWPWALAQTLSTQAVVSGLDLS